MSQPWYKNTGWAVFAVLLLFANLFVWGYRTGFYCVWMVDHVPDLRKPVDVAAGFLLGALLTTLSLGFRRRK